MKFNVFCDALSKPSYGVTGESANAPFGDPSRMINLPDGLTVDFAVLNYAKYIRDVSYT
jgi:hypothetical protein